MSMAGGNAAMQLDFTVNTTQLDRALSEADRRITAATRGTGNTIDRLMEKVSQGIGAKLAGAVTTGLGLKVMDDALRKLADGMRTSKSAGEIGMAIADGIVESIKSIPVAGALTDIVAQLADPIFGSPEEMNRARRNSIAMQQARMESEKAYQELLAQGASEEEAADIAKRKRIESLREFETKALQQYNQTVKTYDETRYQEALQLAQRETIRRPGGKFRDNFDMPLSPAVDRERFRTSESLTPEALAGRRQVREATDAAIARVEQEFEQAARDRAAKAEATAKAADEKRIRDAERMAAEEERRIKAQEEAYDRFIEGNTNDAILALEAQLQAAGTAAAPTRADRLAQLMAGMAGGIATADTALGAFTFAAGDPAQIARENLATAEKQLSALERIEKIQAEIRDLQKGTGFN